MTQKYITVPKDKQAMYNLNHGIENSNELIDWNLTEQEYHDFFNRLDLVNFINNVCDSWLDEAEDDQIEGSENLQKLYNQISKKYDNNDPLIEKLLSFIQEAFDRETFIGFYL